MRPETVVRQMRRLRGDATRARAARDASRLAAAARDLKRRSSSSRDMTSWHEGDQPREPPPAWRLAERTNEEIDRLP